MKKNYLIIAAWGLLLCATGCKRNTPVPPTPAPSPVVTKDSTVEKEADPLPVVKEDTLEVKTVVVEQEGPHNVNAHFKFTIDYPLKGPERLVTAIRKSIFSALGDTATYTDYSVQEMENIGKHYVARATKEIQEILEKYKTRENVGYGNMGKIVMKENQARYVTYYVDSYLYEGGAHGMPQGFFITFDKEKGRALEWNDLFAEPQRAALSALVKQAIVDQYYEGKHEWDEFFKFALPQQVPALTHEGVAFNYQSYEIDAYAAGMPHCLLTYQQVKGLMTQEAQRLIDGE